VISLGYQDPERLPRERRTGLMVAARPEPRAACRGRRSGGTHQRHKGGEQTKNKTLRNPQNFSYEVSHLRVQAKSSSKGLRPVSGMTCKNPERANSPSATSACRWGWKSRYSPKV
jgi:hypothetical protein